MATRNIGISKDDLDRLTAIRAIHFPEETVNYYQELYKEIGFAAKYQLLGGLFAGQEIPDLEIDIPAIKGKMGGHTYFSFSIEPEKLLKIGYVLHRNKAHADMMPAYQRLIKRKRLQEIHRFIDEEKGYFPNSIIINIDIDEKKKTIFEPSGNQVENSISKIGILHFAKNTAQHLLLMGNIDYLAIPTRNTNQQTLFL
ncbi:MAG: DGQHR domain-containing protein [Bacteroidetes bacterium]|nr:DGQHR domain-containing protein [Bacteroidota bacterium]